MNRDLPPRWLEEWTALVMIWILGAMLVVMSIVALAALVKLW